MNVALVNLTSGGLSGGYRKYLLRMVPWMRRDSRVGSVRVFLPAEFSRDVGLRELESEFWPRDDALRGFPWLRHRLDVFQPTVIFVPTSRFLETRFPTVIMVRNMEPLEVPFAGNSWRERIRNVGRCAAARHACFAAASVIAVSEHVKAFLVSRWGLPASKAQVVYHGVDEDLIAATEPSSCLRALAPGEFAFTVGSIRPARGLEDAILAVARLNRAGKPLPLAIAGSVDPGANGYYQKMQRLVSQSGVMKLVTWLGSLSPAEMTWCYRNCRLSLTTSRAEACPNTVLEAMHHGCLCVSTRTPPMPEFFRGACRYYTGRNPVELADVIAELLESPDAEKQALRKKAHAHSLAFTWERTATMTVEALWSVATR